MRTYGEVQLSFAEPKGRKITARPVSTGTTLSKGEAKTIRAYLGQIEALKEYLTELAEAKQSAYDERSEKWQEGEKGEAAQTLIGNLESLAESVDNLTYEINEAVPLDD